MRIRKQKSLIDRAHDYVESVAETVIPQLEAALETAIDKAGPALNDVRDKAAPLLAEGRAIAAEKVSPESVATKVAEVREAPAPQGSKLKKVLLLGGLLAIGGAVFAKLRGSKQDDGWQTSYVPNPAPAPAAPTAEPPAAASEPAAPPAVDDVAGSDPAEALSDAADAPHDVTTPDAPAEIIDVDDVPGDRA